MKRITQTKEIQSGDNSGVIISGAEKLSLSYPFELSEFELDDTITLRAAQELANQNNPSRILSPWTLEEVNADEYRTHPIDGIEYLFRSDIDGNTSEPTLDSVGVDAWTDLGMTSDGFSPDLWSISTMYSIGDFARIPAGSGNVFKSKTNGNIGNEPVSETTDANWECLGNYTGLFPNDAPYQLDDVTFDTATQSVYKSNVDNNNYPLDGQITGSWQVVGVIISDDEVSTTKTWSSQKISEEVSNLDLQKVTDNGNTSTNVLKIIGSSNTPELDGLELFYDETGNAVIQNYKRALEEFGAMFYGGSKHVFDGGNSGFGTSMPTEKIDVIGKVLISEAPTVDNGATRLVDVVNNIPSTYPTISFSDSPIESQLSIFVEKYLTRNSDVTIVQIGDSISTNLNFASPVSDQKNRPPLITEKNINYFLENKLRWKEQSYFRFDNEELFFNNAGGGTIEDISVDDTAWGATGNAYYLPLTRVIDGGTNAGISYLFPSGMRRCDLIIHTDRLWADTTEIEISGGDGRVEVFDYTSETWVEANNYTFSAKEPDTLVSLGFYRDQYQKRIKMRSLVDLGDKGVTVKNVGTGRFGYWGIEMSPREFMFTYICASKGSHNIFMLRRYEEWMVDAFNPDLILQQTCIINEQAQTGVNPSYPAVISPDDFAQNFSEYYDGLIAKGYTVFPYTLFAGLQAGIVHEDTGKWGVGTFEDKSLTIVDYTDALHNMYNSKKAPHVNFFNDFLKIAYSKTEIDGVNNIFTSAIEGSGVSGTTFTTDGIHFNDYGEILAWRLLEPFFNFKGKVNNVSDLESVLLAGNTATTAIDLAVNMGINLNSQWALKYDIAVGGVNLVKYEVLDGVIFADNETLNVGIHNTNPTEALDVVGKIKASVAPTNETDVLRLVDLGTGWAQYTDNSYTSASKLVINSGSTATITNNAAISITNQLPFGITSLFDPATSKITPQLEGDSYLINVRFTAESSSVTGLCDVGIDIGGAMNIISQETISLRKGIGNSQRVNIVFDVFSGSTFLSNGGLIKLTSIDGDTSIYDISFKITRTHKAK